MIRRNLRAASAAAAAVMLAAACGGSSNNTAAQGPAKVQIAIEFMFTPANAPGDAMLKATQLEVKQWNDKGGIHGTKIDLLTWDDQGKAQIAQTLEAQGISDPTVLGMICCQFSGVTLGIMPGLQSAAPPFPFVAVGASNPKVTESGFTVVHRINARDDVQGPADARFLINQGAKKVEIISENDDYGIGLSDQVTSYFKTNAPAVVTQRDIIKAGQTDYSTVITKIKAFSPDWIFSASETAEVAPFVQQLKQAGDTIGQNIQYLGSDGHFDNTINGKSQGAEENAYVSTILPDPSDVPTAASFKQAFGAAYGSDLLGQSVYWGAACEATQILLQAISSSPVNNGKISRADVLAHLSGDTFSTIYGPVKFDSKGDIANSGIFIYQVHGSNLNYLKTVSP